MAIDPIIPSLESEVRSYCRSFPTVFTRAAGAALYDDRGKRYLDFLAGAGALNYGHNHPLLTNALVEYIQAGGIAHGLDMATEAKVAFLRSFQTNILKPRDLSYKVMFPGPTGTNAVEAAVKLARKVTGRRTIVAFTNAFHGMTLGSLALTGNAGKRGGAGIALDGVVRAPFDGYLGPNVATLGAVTKMLEDPSSGVDAPAAFIVETVQGEGGINVASAEWLRELSALAERHDALLIVDDIQAGCGRTGRFFSFEEAGITPDIVTLSKSISGYGLPMSLTLFRPELDEWAPGEHNGTFRGNNLAFVTATAALDHFWSGDGIAEQTYAKSVHVVGRLLELAREYSGKVRGRGLMLGVEFSDRAAASRLARRAFEQGLVIETSGPRNEVLKLLPPLTMDLEDLDAGLDIIAEAARSEFRVRRNGVAPMSSHAP